MQTDNTHTPGRVPVSGAELLISADIVSWKNFAFFCFEDPDWDVVTARLPCVRIELDAEWNVISREDAGTLEVPVSGRGIGVALSGDMTIVAPEEYILNNGEVVRRNAPEENMALAFTYSS